MSDVITVAWLLSALALAMFIVVMWRSEQLARRNKYPLVRKAINLLGLGIMGITGILMAMIAHINGG